jgi:pilus assembly protein CpaB
MQNRRVIALVSALVLAGLGTLVLVLFVSSAEDRALEGEEVVEVLVVQDDIPAGTPAGELGDTVETEKVPAKVANAGAVSDLSQLSGLVAAVNLIPGDQLTAARFTTPEQFSPSRSQIAVPTGLLEITVTLDPARTVGGTITPGDTVAVISSFTSDGEVTGLTLNKVLVTNVQGAPVTVAPTDDDGTATDSRPAAPEGSLLVTLAVDARSAQRIAFTAEYGTMYLAREPADAPAGATDPETVGSIFG